MGLCFPIFFFLHPFASALKSIIKGEKEFEPGVHLLGLSHLDQGFFYLILEIIKRIALDVCFVPSIHYSSHWGGAVFLPPGCSGDRFEASPDLLFELLTLARVKLSAKVNSKSRFLLRESWVSFFYGLGSGFYMKNRYSSSEPLVSEILYGWGVCFI
ncbi:hypothetical protein CDAR_442631 [Caerostris darwini]|uniref:Uncharacterized protein n=1 Tax=Caerostris darwini TaxID=1538125 RepID=A0AAV4PZD0_9ARAC|nr:hypothetical protein CDAR_442631 [Caerostris darwini]